MDNVQAGGAVPAEPLEWKAAKPSSLKKDDPTKLSELPGEVKASKVNASVTSLPVTDAGVRESSQKREGFIAFAIQRCKKSMTDASGDKTQPSSSSGAKSAVSPPAASNPKWITPGSHQNNHEIRRQVAAGFVGIDNNDKVTKEEKKLDSTQLESKKKMVKDYIEQFSRLNKLPLAMHTQTGIAGFNIQSVRETLVFLEDMQSRLRKQESELQNGIGP